MSSVVAMDNGGVAFVEGQDVRIRRYDATGREMWRFGKSGSGPGEFEKVGPSALLRLGRVADTLWIYDMSLRRMTLLSGDGRLLRAFGPPARWTVREGAEPDRVDALAYAGSNALLAQARYAGVGRGAHYEVVSGSTAGEIAARITADADFNYGQLSVTVGEHVHFFYPVMLARPHRDWAEDGQRFAIVTTTMNGSGGSFTVRMYQIGGAIVFERTYPFVGLPIPRRYADSVIAFQMKPDSRFRVRPDVQAVVERRLRETVPPFFPPVTGIHIGSDYGVWLRGLDDRGIESLRVLDGRGTVVGRVVLPPRTYFAAATRDVLWATQYDADDVPSLVRYRIQRN